jgi:ectoine hydroxylase-related dioxygenase (phytanoyl-CoA dioxygenase family)
MLSAAQIEQFHRDGVLVLRGVFGEQEVNGLREAAEEVQREALAGAGSGHGYRVVDGKRRYYRTDGGLWDRHVAFRAATVHPGLLAAIGQCLGHPFMPVNDSLVVKLPRSSVSIPWHQDPPYAGPDGLAGTFGIPNFDCDIYLDDATLDNGCLYALAGYHLVGRVELERFPEEQLFDRADAIALEMRPGDVLFHAVSTPHGSRANDSDTVRRVFYLHYMAREVLETLHPEWASTKRGFAPSDIERARAMIDERARFRMSASDTAGCRLTTEGFVFPREPATPPRHWEALVAELSPGQVRAAKTLGHDPAFLEADHLSSGVERPNGASRQQE